MSAIAIRQGDVQLQVQAEGSELKLYAQGSLHSLPNENEVYFVTNNGVNSVLNNGLDIQNIASHDSAIQPTSTDQVSVQVDDSDTLVITTPGGATVMVALQMSFLRATVVLTNSYINQTRGLMGVFNRDPANDFTLPNGTVLRADLTEPEVYTYGLECKLFSHTCCWIYMFVFDNVGHVRESDSIFYYLSNASYDTYNSNYLTFVPTFTSDLMGNLPSDVDTVCQGNQACFYDYSISGNADLGNSSHTAAMDGQNLQTVLSKTASIVTMYYS